MNLVQQQQAFLLIAIKQNPETAEHLFSYMKPADRDALKTVLETLRKHPTKTVQKVADTELKKVSQYRNLSYLADVHDDWIVESLLGESAAMIATVLRYLPAERVRTILDSLPQIILDQLPRMGDTYLVPTALVDMLRERFEKQFWLHRTYDQKQAFEFEHLCLLRAMQIREVFLEMGYREIALGLISLPDQAKTVVMDRLSRSDRARVEYYLNQGKSISEQRVKRAQNHLISLHTRQGEQSRFVIELGYQLFAKALLLRDRSDLEVIKRKMSHLEAGILQRIVDKAIDSNSEASVVASREDLLVAVKRALEKPSFADRRPSSV